jgi:16S rRNA (adenine1518-N6/adenine1519-N6)-dimethyltransferase
MTLSEIQRVLAELGTSPTRSLGQNFLHDQNLARWIVDRLDIQPGDHIVEVGPGLGALTEFLAMTGNSLTLIEKDSRLIPHLRAKFEGGTTRVFHVDALDFDLREILGRGPVKVVGNLPYYVSTPLIEKFTSALSPASLLVLTLQWELARRLGATPGTKDFGAMTICVNRRWKATFLKKMPASVFFPAPKVDSAVLSLERRPFAEVCPLDESVFDALVRRGFSERRKQLRNLLPDLAPRWEEVTSRLGVPLTVRGEELSLAQWETLAGLAAPSAAQSGAEMFDVVDSEDRVLRSEPREVVHVNNFWHRAVHMVAENGLGELFLQKRSIWKDRNPGLWDSSAAGHVDSGETYLEAAEREFREELGLDCPPLVRIGRLAPSEITGWEFIEVYRTRHEGPFSPAPMEVETGAFFPLRQIMEWTESHPGDFSPVFLECLKLLVAARQHEALPEK